MRPKHPLRIYFWIFVLVLGFAIYWHFRQDSIRDAGGRAPGDRQVTTIQNLFKNHWVQVWKATMTPGAPAYYHHDDTPRVLIPLIGGQLKLVDQEGEVSYLDLEYGKATWVDADDPGTEHMSIVAGSKNMEAVVVEIEPEVVKAFEFYKKHVKGS